LGHVVENAYPYKYAFWLRTAAFTRAHPVLWPIHFLARFILRHLQFKCGIQISYDTSIAPGFYTGHWGEIVVYPEARIGRNCNINHDVCSARSAARHPQLLPSASAATAYGITVWDLQ
jgi:serine acetyltransferase